MNCSRQKTIYFNLKVLVFIGENYVEKQIALPDFFDVSNAKEVIVVGAGPAGLFACLQLILSGFKPILLERGKDVMKRPFDLKEVNIHHNVNEDSIVLEKVGQEHTRMVNFIPDLKKEGMFVKF
ncbi:hypothetical protein LEP1GSC088_0088 [Leptospira interrogans str. L1207]|nr:hypothetical protein LEP1GSC088_0088 [Leptospira interrogans str. L1207]